MAKIGDYIHSKIDGYRMYGTFRPDGTGDGSPYYAAQSVYALQKQKMLTSIKGSSVDKRSLNNLSEKLSQLIYGDPSLSHPSDDELMNKMRKTIERIYGEKFSNFGINWTEGMGVYPKIKQISSPQFNKKRLEKYILLLNNMMDRLSTGLTNFSKNGNLSQIANTISLLEDQLKNIENNNEYVTLSNDLMDNINLALKAESLPYALAIGDIFENFLGVAQYALSGNINNVTDELIKSNIVGTTGRSTVTIDASNFSDEYVNFNDSGDLYVNDNTTYRIKANETQDKLDVIFNWDGAQLNVTAKNYNLKDSSSTIHLVSGTSLLYLIQNEDAYFVNHWLNIMGNVSRSSKIIDNLQDAHLSMKLTIFVKALTGQRLGRAGEADTFILNWRSQKRVYVLSVTDIIYTVSKDIDSMINIKGYPTNGSLKNQWVGAKSYDMGNAMQRITNLLGRVYATKISVSLKQNAITYTT